MLVVFTQASTLNVEGVVVAAVVVTKPLVPVPKATSTGSAVIGETWPSVGELLMVPVRLLPDVSAAVVPVFSWSRQ